MIKRLSHIAIVVNNLADARKIWGEAFHLIEKSTEVIPIHGIKNAFLVLGDNLIELIEPIDHQDMNNPVARWLATRGEGLYHLALIVDDVAEEAKLLQRKGVTIMEGKVSDSSVASSWNSSAKPCWVHPKSASGTLLALLQEKP